MKARNQIIDIVQKRLAGANASGMPVFNESRTAALAVAVVLEYDPDFLVSATAVLITITRNSHGNDHNHAA
jgi:hypothetical protein